MFHLFRFAGWAYFIGLWGDVPYSDRMISPSGRAKPHQDMNSQNLMFSVFDGDLKAGNGINGSLTPPCATLPCTSSP